MPELLQAAGIVSNSDSLSLYATLSVQQFIGVPGLILGYYLVDTKIGRK